MKCSMARLETLLALGTLLLFGCQQQWVSPYSASHTIAASMMPIDGISLIADLNSLHGRKKFPVRMRRELVHNALI